MGAEKGYLNRNEFHECGAQEIGCLGDFDVLRVDRQNLHLIPDSIMQEIIAVGACGFMRSAEDPDFQEDVRSHILAIPDLNESAGEIQRDKSVYLLTDGEGVVQAFACISDFVVMDGEGFMKVLHIEGFVLSEAARHNGYGRGLVGMILEKRKQLIDLGLSLLESRFPDEIGRQEYDTSRVILDGCRYTVIVYHTANCAMRGIVDDYGEYNVELSEIISSNVGTDARQIVLIQSGDVADSSRVIVVHKGRYGPGGLYGRSLGERLIVGLNEERGDAEQFAIFVHSEYR